MRFLRAVGLSLVLCSGWGSGPSPAYPSSAGDVPALIAHWAPTLYHDIDANPSYRNDFLTRFDFDGDWNAWNNQENMESGAYSLTACVYYSIIESETHYFLTYAFFHPYDSSILLQGRKVPLCILHENDMEGVTFTVRKDGSPTGQLRVSATEAHGDVYYFKPDGSDVLIGSAYLDPLDPQGHGPDSLVHYPQTGDAHPAVFVEADGHGVGGLYRAMRRAGEGYLIGGETYAFVGDDGLLYYFDGGPAEEPTGAPAESVRYELRPLEELWSHRGEGGPGGTYCDYEDYVGARGCTLLGLAVSFGGTCQLFDQCAANPPWGWDSDAPGLAPGDWFLDPAYVTGFAHLEHLPERESPGFTSYVSHPFLRGDKYLELLSPTGGSLCMAGDTCMVRWTFSDSGQGPALGDVVDLELRRGEGPWEVLAEDWPLRELSYPWRPTPPPSDSCRIRITLGTDCYLSLIDVSEPFDVLSDSLPDVPPPPPTAFRLYPNVPDPLSHRTSVSYDLPHATNVWLSIYGPTGRMVRALRAGTPQGAGRYRVEWDGRNEEGRAVASGVYFCRLRTPDYSRTEKMMVTR